VSLAAQAKAIEVARDIDSIDPITGDHDRLQQVVWNLLSNAVKFTPPKGRVTVGLKRVEDDVVLRVEDTGIGISQEFLPYVFDRFRQADATATRRHGGLGLGMAIVRHLVELHGGTVRVDSAGEGQGATFTITLPARLEVRAEAAGVAELATTANAE
jgi:signal transduction histidine kinase